MRGGDYNGKFTAKTKKKISRSIKQAYQISEALWMKRFTLKQYRWWNNGEKEVKSIECPGEGWFLGKKFKLKKYPVYTAKYFKDKFNRLKKKCTL